MLHQLLSRSAVALALMAVLSIALGWFMAGRVLRPLRTITAAAREISADRLGDRLALGGPRDELKELGDTFDALLARLEASFRAQRQFIANASHELRTPLARQRAISQVALADPGATIETLRTAHERVLAAGAQQQQLIEALLTLARGQAGLDKPEPFDLADRDPPGPAPPAKPTPRPGTWRCTPRSTRHRQRAARRWPSAWPRTWWTTRYATTCPAAGSMSAPGCGTPAPSCR